MNIAYFAMDKGGCTFYRAMQPLDTLYQQKLANVMRIEKGEDQDRVAEAFAGGEVIVFPRLAAGKKSLYLIEELKKDGKLVVVDYDDNVWEVGPLSPHYADFGEFEHNYKHPTRGMVPLWKDGENNFHIKENIERRELVGKALASASLVTTTTEILAEEFRRYNPNVAVLPNCVDLDRWKKLPLLPHRDEFRIFWAGGSSHYEDWLILAPVLPEIFAKYPQVKLVLVGVKFEGPISQLPKDRVEFHSWEDNLSYPLRSAILAADLSLIPLQDNAFNRCKSPIKWIEQAALEVPCVVSNVSPYREIYNGYNAAMVEGNNKDAWVAAISTMIEQPLVRRRMAEEGRKYVEQHFDMNKQAVRWLEVYQEHLDRVKKPVEELACAAG